MGAVTENIRSRCLLRYLCLLALLTPFVALSGIPEQDGTHFLTHDGEERWYHYHLPDGYDAAMLYPVVLNFHGGGGDASRTAETGFSDTADAHGFIAVYPQGVGSKVFGAFVGVWNGGNCCGIASEENVDDVGFVDLVLDDLELRYGVDPKRVYATGISNGAMMSYRLACDLSNRIAAIAPIAGMAQGLECEPQRPVAVLHIHGTADKCSLYDSRFPVDPGFCPVEEKAQLSGGCFQIVLSELLGIPVEPVCFYQQPVQGYVNQWRRFNECPREVPPVVVKNGAALCRIWGPCASDTEVALCAIKGGGHTWPGGEPAPTCIKDPEGPTCTLLNEVLGITTQDLDANEAMWEFFSHHSLP